MKRQGREVQCVSVCVTDKQRLGSVHNYLSAISLIPAKG